MKRAVIISALVVFVWMFGCEEKESFRIKEISEVKTFKKHERKDMAFTSGEPDEFHPESRFESTRKSVLTDFGKLKNPPQVTTTDQDTAAEDLQYPNTPQVFIMSFTNKTIDFPAYPFDYENDVNALKKLYDTHNLDSVIRKGMSELEILSALMVYANRFLDGGRLPTFEEKRSISGPSAEIITKLRRNNGIGGTSEEYASLFCQLSLACGYNARIISMHTFDENGNFLTNDVCEVFLNRFDKWAVFDTYNRATFYLREDVPLSALEIRTLMLENRYREIITKSGIGDFADVISVREKLLPRYQYIYMWRMNDILSRSKVKTIFSWQALYYSHLVWEDGYAPVAEGGFDKLDKFTGTEHPDYTLDGVRYVTHEKSDFYWSINHSTINISRTGQESLRLYFDTMTPNFDHFLFYVDGVIQKSKYIFDLNLPASDFKLRSVNRFGIMGPISRIEIMQ